jgi:hypothetical protein
VAGLFTGGWAVSRKLGWDWLMGAFDVLCRHCGYFVGMAGRL